MAKKAKGNRVQVILECTEHKASGMPGTSRYITTKNRKNTTERLELKKYNPILKKVTVHKERGSRPTLSEARGWACICPFRLPTATFG